MFFRLRCRGGIFGEKEGEGGDFEGDLLERSVADFCAGVVDELHEASEIGERELCGECCDRSMLLGG